MSVVIDEMITEVQPQRSPGGSREGSGDQEGAAARTGCDAALRRRLERIRERRLRLEAD